MYTYRAHVTKVVDGDTVDCLVDLGFFITIKQRLRLNGINAPEKNTEAGLLSKRFLEEVLPVGTTITIQSNKPGAGDKYGRFLCTIFLEEENINESLVSSGHALAWDGQGVKPV